MISVHLLSLVLFTVDALPPQTDIPGLSLPQRLVGKVLVWCLKLGMTSEQIVTVFGQPDTTFGDVRGMIGDEVIYRSASYWYLRYGVTVDFSWTVRWREERSSPGERVRGGIQ